MLFFANLCALCDSVLKLKKRLAVKKVLTVKRTHSGNHSFLVSGDLVSYHLKNSHTHMRR